MEQECEAKIWFFVGKMVWPGSQHQVDLSRRSVRVISSGQTEGSDGGGGRAESWTGTHLPSHHLHLCTVRRGALSGPCSGLCFPWGGRRGSVRLGSQAERG